MVSYKEKDSPMLSGLAVFVGENLGMKNRIEQYQEIEKTKFTDEVLDKNLAQDLARADDDGFAVAKNNSGTMLTEENSDCWNDLWQRIKAKGARFFIQKK